jgi:hypothetical protein
MSERTVGVRLAQVLLAGSAVVALVGCSGHSATSPFSSVSPGAASTASFAAPPPSAASPGMKATARATAVQFYDLYFARKFKLSWNLLAPEAKRHISQSTWIKVHSSCLASYPRKTGEIKSITIFGDAAIVTETITAASQAGGEIEAVFNYANGRWGYSPGDLSIYQHGSVARDIAAAKAAGFCSTGNRSIL